MNKFNAVAVSMLSMFTAVSANAATLTTLATFTGTNGADPNGSLILDSTGNLYGTTSLGGTRNAGTVFKVNSVSGALTTLVNFAGTNGSSPLGSLTVDATGNMYGTTSGGGSNGIGTVFKLSANGATLTTLANFNTGAGNAPNGSLTFDATGNLYGTTRYGGGANNMGTVFKLGANGGALTPLVTFNGANGANPEGSLTIDSAGNLYGTTTFGAARGVGTVFKLDSNSGALTTLASFNGTNGARPRGDLTLDAAGNLYGTTSEGGLFSSGTVFKLGAGNGALTTLANITSGRTPEGSLIVDAAGNLYGTALMGGSGSFGTVFKLDAISGALTTLASFSAPTGGYPRGSLIADASGNLYGTTSLGGGVNARGTVFRLSDTGFVVSAVAAVPEPATWALMLVGFGLMGAVMRTRRRDATVTYA